MTLSGWIILGISVSLVVIPFVWSFWKILGTPHETEHVHGFEKPPPDIAEDQHPDNSQANS